MFNKKEYDRQWALNNPENIKQINKRYRKKNSSKRNEYQRKWKNERYITDLKYNLNCRMGVLIWQTLKANKNDHHWKALIDYTLDELIKYLQKTIPIGYTWQDYLQGKLHIDHIVPKSVFNYTNPEHIDFKRCWALSNLRLLPAEENMKKNNKLTKPFQPALQI